MEGRRSPEDGLLAIGGSGRKKVRMGGSGRLKPCILDLTGIDQLADDREEAGGGRPEQFQMPAMMEIGAEKVDILLFNEELSQFYRVLAIMSDKGEQVELEQAPGILQLVEPTFIRAEIQVALGVSKDGPVAADLHFKEYLF